MIYLIISVILIIILMNLHLDIYISEKEFKIKIFSVKIFSKNGDKFLSWIKKISNVKQTEQTKKIEIDILKHLTFRKIEIYLHSIVNNDDNFFYQNIILKTIIENIYPYFSKNIPCIRFKYLKSEDNRFKINIKINLNIFMVLIQFLKGKILYGTKRYKSNAQ